MFFEPLPAGEVTATGGFHLPERPLWSGPPALETGAILAVEQTVARSPNVVLRVPTIRAFRTGCMLDVEVVSRQGGRRPAAPQAAAARRAVCRWPQGHDHRAAATQDTGPR